MDLPEYQQEMWPYISGTVWHHPTWCHSIVLTYLKDSFALLSILNEQETSTKGWAISPITEKNGTWLYSFEELPKRLQDWECKGIWYPNIPYINQHGTKEQT